MAQPLELSLMDLALSLFKRAGLEGSEQWDICQAVIKPSHPRNMMSGYQLWQSELQNHFNWS